MKKTAKEIKKFYAFENYKPTKNAVPVTYKGKNYLSKAQCIALEGITRKELDEYLKGGEASSVTVELPDEPTLDDIIF